MKSHYNGLQLNGYNQRGLPIGLSHQKKMNRTPVKIKDALFVSAENIARVGLEGTFVTDSNLCLGSSVHSESEYHEYRQSLFQRDRQLLDQA